MLAKERHAIIMDILARNKIIKITDIVQRFDISNETARRDLESLQDQKLVKRIYGGAILATPSGGPPEYSSRTARSLKEKAAIGREAAALVNAGETIILGIGTTTLEIARNLKDMANITVLTHSLPIINELAGSKVNLFALGGRLNSDELCMFGKLTIDALQQFYVDKAFIGAGGVTFQGGISEYNSEEAQVCQTLISRAGKVILTTDSGKFGINAFSVVCPLEQADVIVTDDNLPSSFIDGIRERKIELILARCEEDEEENRGK